MAEHPWFKFYEGDYLKKTGNLTLEQHGAYMLLMIEYYSTGSPLPQEHMQLHRICRCQTDAERAAVALVVDRFFELREDGYHHERIDKELDKRLRLSAVRSESAQRRWNPNGDANAHANGDAKGGQKSDVRSQMSDIKPQIQDADANAPAKADATAKTEHREAYGSTSGHDLGVKTTAEKLCLANGWSGKPVVVALAAALEHMAKRHPEMSLEQIGEELVRGYKPSMWKYGVPEYCQSIVGCRK